MVLVVIVLVAVSGSPPRRVVPAPGGLCRMIWPPIASTRSLSPARPTPREVDRDGGPAGEGLGREQTGSAAVQEAAAEQGGAERGPGTAVVAGVASLLAGGLDEQAAAGAGGVGGCGGCGGDKGQRVGYRTD